MTTETNTTTTTTTAHSFREAYARCKPEIDAVGEADLVTINVDVQGVLTSTRGRLGPILAFHERVIKETPLVDASVFVKLEDYLLAAAYTHSQYRGTAQATQSLPEKQAEAAEERDTLFSDLSALDRRGLIDGSRLVEIKGTAGYRSTAFDLLTLYTMARENWERIEGKTALTLEELERAGALANELMQAVGARESNGQAVATAILNRQRAFTLFARAYDQVRRCIQFLRWNEGDADEIAPSLYAGRRRRPGSDLRPDAEPATSPSTVEEKSSVVASPAAVQAPVAAVAEGLPGQNPFVK